MDPPPPSLRRDPAAAGRQKPKITTEAQRTRRQKYNPQISQITQITTGVSHVTGVEDLIRTAVSFRSCRPAEVRSRNLRNLCNLRIYLKFSSCPLCLCGEFWFYSRLFASIRG